jgi:hypothetical protein
MIPNGSFPLFAAPQQFCDSAAVFNPNEDVNYGAPDAAGWRTVTMRFKSPACIRRNLPCMLGAIDASVKFRPNAAAQGGYEVEFIRDGYPAMGVYARNATDTGWDTAKEDAQKTKSGVGAIRALAGQIRSKGYNYPPPSDPPPPGCFRQ